MKTTPTRQIAVVVLSALLLFSCGESKSEREARERAEREVQELAERELGLRASKLRGFNLSRCPPDYRDAFLVHIQAYERADELDKALKTLNSDENAGRVLIGSAISHLFDLRTTPFQDALEAEQELKKQLEIAKAEIKQTKNIVDRIAVAYGMKP